MSGFWDVVLLLLSTFVFVAYLFILFHIVVDLFRDTEMGGGTKALWIIGLVSSSSDGADLHTASRSRHRSAAARRSATGESGCGLLHSSGSRKITRRPDRRCESAARCRHESTPMSTGA